MPTKLKEFLESLSIEDKEELTGYFALNSDQEVVIDILNIIDR